MTAIKAERRERGKLRIFFGYVEGVGTTCAMLEGARDLAGEGRNVLIGIAESHGRAEAELLLEGMEILPRRNEQSGGIVDSEFDLDGALKRRPEVVVLDELAHTNAAWCRHKRRYEDALELLEAGVDVLTTLNVQHLAGLSEVVSGIVGVRIVETVPDAVFDEAAYVDLVDISPEELAERVHEGKIRLPRPGGVGSGFFRRENLLALRELALRRNGERADRGSEGSLRGAGGGSGRKGREPLMVAVSASRSSAALIQRARRMAASFGVPWIACSVNTGGIRSSGDSEQLRTNLAVAERLGAEVQLLEGENAAWALLNFAAQRNVTRIVVGKNRDRGIRRLLNRSVAERLIRGSGDIDIYVVQGPREGARPNRFGIVTRRRVPAVSVLLTLLAIGAATGVAMLFREASFTEPNIMMSYVFEVFVVALFLGWVPGAIASVGSVLAFNFFFTRPYYTLAVDNAEYLVTFAVMLSVSLITSQLVQRVRRQMELTRERQRRAETLYRLSMSLASAGGASSMRLSAEEHLTELFGSRVVVVRKPEELKNKQDVELARSVIERGEAAGYGTAIHSESGSVFLPLPGSESTLGALVVPIGPEVTALVPDQRQLLEASASLIAFAIEREELAEKARRMILEAEHERSQNALLRAISHDLRTPLATITGAASTLKAGGMDNETATQLIGAVDQEAQWLSDLVENLLQLTRLDAEVLPLKLTRETIDDIVSSAVSHFDHKQVASRLRVRLPDEIVTIDADPTLLQELVINLIDNALKYSEASSIVDLTVTPRKEEIEIAVGDRGWGFAADEVTRVFERFYRGARSAGVRGTGLGLAICRAIVTAHGGSIDVQAREGGGSVVEVLLPLRRSGGGNGVEAAPAFDPGDR